ncbi:MAG: glycosyltransferase [Candidatus Marsarchaeota archaeon]|nr:glycosyltransferase [Candidatus Marsarchaeota archaeon]
MAHNEEATIGKVLDGLLRQELSLCHINEIFVVASGCTDHTVDAAKRLADQDERVKVLVQERREGKASAINLFLRNASEDIVIVMGGDTIPSPSMVERLISPLANPEVGMTGGRPVPLNDSRTFFGFASHLLWDLHHELALQSPKLGEAVAFRKLFSIIPVDTPVDELSVQALITGMGLKLQYVQDAVLYNRGPDNLHDFISQRRRIYCGHLRVQADQMYEASTMDARRILPLWLRRLGPGPKNAMWACCVAGLEFYSRIMGRQDFRCKKQHHVWSVVSSTKQVTKGLREGRAIDNRDSLLALRIRDFDGLSARLGRREAQQMIGRLADFLAGDLREGRLIKTVPAKGLIVLTADVDNLEVEQAIARASMRMRPGNLSTAKAGVTAIASFDFTYGLFPLGEGFGPAGKFVAGDAQARAGQGLDGLVQM